MSNCRFFMLVLLLAGLSIPVPGQTVVAAASGRKVDSAKESVMPGVIRTIVGGGRPTFTAGGNALESILEGASGIAVDAEGNRYVAGFLAHRVFKIDPSGKVTALAGVGTAATSGDGGPAAKAAINGPSSVAVDGSVVYVVEQLGGRIRRIDEKGRITTVAGGGGRETAGREGLPATEAFLEVPNGIALREGEILFTEFGGNRVRKIGSDGVLTTVAGTGAAASSGDGRGAKLASLHGPTGIVADGKGNIYVAEMFAGRVRRIDASGGISTFVGSGPRGQAFEGKQATSAFLRAPNGLALDAGGNLYVADFADNRVYAVNKRGVIKTLAGTQTTTTPGNIGVARSGPAKDVPVESPLGMTFDQSGHLLVVLYNQGAVLSVESGGASLADDASAVIRHVAGEFAPPLTDDVSPGEVYLKNAAGVSTDSKGNVFVSDVFANRVIKVSFDDEHVTTIIGATSSGTGATNDFLDVLRPVGVVPISNGLVVMEADGHRVRFITDVALARRESRTQGRDTRSLRQVSGARTNSLFLEEFIYIDDAFHPHGGDEFARYTFAGATKVPIAEKKPALVEASLPGRQLEPFFVYVDTGNNRVRKIDEQGVATTVAGNGNRVSTGDGGPAVAAGLDNPQDVVVDAQGNLYISESYRVRRVDARTGVITTVVGNGEKGFSGFGGPAVRASITSAYGMAMDGEDLYIADPWAGVVYRVDGKGVITVAAGNGERNSNGDGGLAEKAGLNAPADVAIRKTADGVELLIAELEGGRVRAVKLR